MVVKNIESYEEFQHINNSFTPVLIEFWAKWCIRSEEMSLDGPSKKYHRPGFYKVDIDAHPEISAAVGIRALPTFIIYHKGKNVFDIAGMADDPGALDAMVQHAQFDLW